jgi:hypothetical protein
MWEVDKELIAVVAGPQVLEGGEEEKYANAWKYRLYRPRPQTVTRPKPKP